jgi:excisionase family DNA binding protein
LENQTTLTRPAATLSHPMGEGHDDLLTQEEVAARLKVTVRTVVRLQHDGVIPFILLGKSVRFFWPTVVSHLNANSTVCRVAAPPAIRPSMRSATMQPANKGGRP